MALRFPLSGAVKPTGVPSETSDSAPSLSANLPEEVASQPSLTKVAIPVRADAIFAYVPRPAFADAFEQALPAPSKETHYVVVDYARMEGKHSPLWQKPGEGRMVIPLPDGRAVSVVIADSEMLSPDRSISTGQVEGQPLSRAVVSWNRDGQMSMSLEMVSLAGDSTLHDYALRATGRGEAQFFEVDSSKVRSCFGGVLPKLNAAMEAVLRERVYASSITSAKEPESVGADVTTAAASNPKVTIDLMFLYTTAVYTALNNSESAFQSTADTAIAQINTAYTSSGINAKVRLAKVLRVDYDETASSSDKVESDALTALSNFSDGKIDEIHAARDTSGADLVCLFHARADDGSVGLGYMMKTPSLICGDGARTIDDRVMSLVNDYFGFCVVEYSFINTANVVAHELGHNLGCQHDRENAQNSEGNSSNGAFSYSFGYRFNGANGVQYRTIMAYAPGQRLGYFSNPEITAPAPVSAPLGIAAGAAGEAYNTLTINRTAFEVSNYRAQKQTPASAGTLLAVSTRAYVGTGDQQLIAGIVVNGSTPKQILLRGVGPALLASGLTNVLTDPKMTLYNLVDHSVVATNDDWQGVPNDPAVLTNTFMQQCGLGAFTSPKESALLVTLPQGVYTANIEGVNGAEGVAIVEAYETSAENSPKIVALSTRGYAGTDGREMIAGFVVRGTVGQPKRILIRVHGPTLLRDNGVSGAMSDPFMELHGADGSLIAANDDWCMDTSVAGDAFTPKVNTYHEQQIFDTGYAPKNRRESALLLDLAPGLYTAIVRPFFDADQPAAPGVALVDVYEINQ